MNELRQLYDDGKLIPFIGSGLSRPFNIPTWKELIYDFAKQQDESFILNKSFDNLMRGNKYYEAIGYLLFSLNKSDKDFKEYIASIIRQCQDKAVANKESYKSVYSKLSELNFKRYFTTNYDTLLSYFTQFDISDLRRYEGSTSLLLNEQRVVFHLHGQFHSPYSTIVTIEDYRMNYRDEKFKRLLSAFFSQYSVLFIGFSFEDSYFCEFLNNINSFANTKHYIILNNPDAYTIQYFKTQYRLEVISYNAEKSEEHTVQINTILQKLFQPEKDFTNDSAVSRSDENNKNEWHPFIVDAADIPGGEISIKKLLYKNTIIDQFLIPDSHYRCVCSPAGLGKTLLLMTKRHILNEKGYLCIPSNQDLIDKIDPDELVLTGSNESLLTDDRTWMNIWKMSIALCVLKKYIQKQDTNENLLQQEIFDLGSEFGFVNKVFNSIIFNKPTDIIKGILLTGRREMGNLIKDCLPRVDSLFPHIRANYAVFIDNADEFTEHDMDPSLENGSRKTAFGLYDPKIWFNIQNGLLLAGFKLSRLNKHVKIYHSIRKEAYDYLQKKGLSMFDKLEDHICQLKYEPEDLKEILINYINTCPIKFYAKNSSVSKDPIETFFGENRLVHNDINYYEDVFRYMYRHSLQRPRDFIQFCKNVINRRNYSTLKDIINDTSTEIAYKYVNDNLKFINSSTSKKVMVSDLFKLLSSSVLSRSDVKRICSTYNGSKCSEGNECSKCDGVHVFCFLYSIGLLGIINYKSTYGRYVQSFVDPSERHVINAGSLPYSNYYFLHPCLFDDPFKSGQKYLNNAYNMIIGDGYSVPEELAT